MRSEQEVNRAMERHADTVRRLCLIHLKNHADTEDIFQNVFLKYALSSIRFESEEHERAWFIRVTLNACRDLLRRFFRRRTVSLEKLVEQPAQIAPDHREVLEAVLALPQTLPRRRLPALLRGHDGPTDRGGAAQKRPYGLYAADAGAAAAEGNAGRRCV